MSYVLTDDQAQHLLLINTLFNELKYLHPQKKIPKGYSLHTVKSAKHGLLYYVRYIVKGHLVRSRWSTHTNNYYHACQFALENRDRLLQRYENRKQKKITSELYPVMNNFYEAGSIYMTLSNKRGRVLSEKSRKVYHHFMLNTFIPYLKKHHTKTFAEIDTPYLAQFQNYLLLKNIKPQTINHYMSYINTIFMFLITEGKLTMNPCTTLSTLKIGEEDEKITGCFEVTMLKGSFNKRFTDKKEQLLLLLVYTTNMRNSEIEKIQVSDLITIEKIHFIDIPKSKTKHGTRVVPLHEYVYKRLTAYIKKHSLTNYVFTDHGEQLPSSVYHHAVVTLGKSIQYNNDFCYTTKLLKDNNITFRSGRHFWKTLMNSQGLGDVEEYFMGHKVTGDVAKRYNHRDKQGQKMIVKKAKEVLKILDKFIFYRKHR